MKINALFYIATMLTVTAYGDTVNFDNETPGILPPHWVGTQTGLGKAKWTIEKADDAHFAGGFSGQSLHCYL